LTARPLSAHDETPMNRATIEEYSASMGEWTIAAVFVARNASEIVAPGYDRCA